MRDKLYIGELNGVQLDFTTGSFTDIHNVTGHIRNAVLTQSVAAGTTGFAPSSDAVYSFVTGVSGALDSSNTLYTLSGDAAGANSANIVLSPDDGGTSSSVNLTGLTGITISRNANIISIGHADTSTQASSTNTSGVVVQSLSVDDYGHLTSISTTDLDTRYLQLVNTTLDTVTTNGNTTANSITVGDVTASKLTITGATEGTILAPSTLYIDPAAHDNVSGKVVILGDLDVRGATTYINSTDVQIGDKNIILATGATESQADGAGFIISGTEGSYGSFTYSAPNDRFDSSLPIYSTGGFLGNATTATSLKTPISVAINGDVTGLATGFDGSSNLTISVDVINGSHEHNISDISGLQTALNNTFSTFTGAVTSITGENLTANRALTSDAFGKVAVSLVSTTELNYVSGVTGQLQTQIDTKANKLVQVIAGSGIAGGGDLTADRTFSTTSDQGHLNTIKLGDDQTNIGGGTNTTEGGILVGRARGTSATAISLTQAGGGSGNLISINADSTLSFEGIVAARDEDADSADGADSAAWKIMGVMERDSDSTNMILSQVTVIAKGTNAQGWSVSLSAGTNGLALQGNGQSSKNIVWSCTVNYNIINS